MKDDVDDSKSVCSDGYIFEFLWFRCMVNNVLEIV